MERGKSWSWWGKGFTQKVRNSLPVYYIDRTLLKNSKPQDWDLRVPQWPHSGGNDQESCQFLVLRLRCAILKNSSIVQLVSWMFCIIWTLLHCFDSLHPLHILVQLDFFCAVATKKLFTSSAIFQFLRSPALFLFTWVFMQLFLLVGTCYFSLVSGLWCCHNNDIKFFIQTPLTTPLMASVRPKTSLLPQHFFAITHLRMP